MPADKELIQLTFTFEEVAATNAIDPTSTHETDSDISQS